MAGTNRIITWAKVMVQSNVLVKVYVTKPTEKENEVINKMAVGTFQGIHFEYVNNTTIWPSNRTIIRKVLVLFYGYISTILKIINDKPTTVITYSSDLNTRVSLILLKPFLKFRLIIEETEFPKILKKEVKRLLKMIYLNSYKYADGMLVMTDELRLYYKSLNIKNILVLPMTVDNSRFLGLKKQKTDRPYFVYVGGSGGFTRDGIFDIIKAFHLVLKKRSDHILKIVGPIIKTGIEYRLINEYISENKLNENIKFIGPVPAYEIPQLLTDAIGIVMAPPSNFVSGGFPTKLGEYLASGTPVICTNVSDISKYLNSNNSFLVEPQNVNEIFNAMMNIIYNPSRSLIIGREGCKLTNSVFNANYYKASLRLFLLNN